MLVGLSGYDVSEKDLDIALAVEFALFIPVLSVTSRRLHDVGLTGWLQAPVVLIYLGDLDLVISGFSDIRIVELISNASYLFFVLILIICTLRSNVRGNKYGPAPNSPDMGAVFN